MRLDKLLANSGLGTRSEVRKLISQGVVTVSGKATKDAGLSVDMDTDITVNGVKLQATEYLYYLLDKPDGVLTAMEDPRLANIGDFIPDNLKGKKLAPVGRLDYHTSGLLIITNDGTLSHRLCSPKYKIPKTYLVTYDGKDWTQDEIDEISKGITLTDMDKPVKLAPATLIKQEGNKSLITLTEGKTHEVRRIFAKYSKEVLSLRRISLAGLNISEEDDKTGTLRLLTNEEIDLLKKATGIT